MNNSLWQSSLGSDFKSNQASFRLIETKLRLTDKFANLLHALQQNRRNSNKYVYISWNRFFKLKITKKECILVDKMATFLYLLNAYVTGIRTL